MRRQSVLRFAGLATAALLAAGVLTSCSSSGGNSDSKAGNDSGGSKTLHVTLANHVWTDVIRKDIPQFEKKTGLKVVVNQLSEDQLEDAYKVKLNAGSSDVDVMMYRPLQVGKLFAKSGYFEDLGSDVKSDSNWDWKDYQKGPVNVTTYKGKVVGVPIITETEVLYYRKDLLQKAGLSVPTTLPELEADAKKLNNIEPGVAGFVARTQASAAVTQFSSFLYSYGGDFIKGNDKSGVGSDAAKKAYAFYGGLIHDDGPAKVSTDMSWPEAMAIFTQGNAAFYTEASSLYANATDPTKSKVADKVGFAAFPAGPAGSKAYNVAAWALGINSASKNKSNAWKFIHWASSKAMALKLQKAGVPSARTSVWSNPAGTAELPKDLAAAIAKNGKNGVGHDRPLVVGVDQAREIVGTPIVTAITGGDVDAAATKADKDFQDLLDSEK